MADNNPLRLPGDFQPGKFSLQRHDLMIDWRRRLNADRAIAGPGIRESQTPQGRIFSADVGAAVAAMVPGPFRIILGTVEAEDPEDPPEFAWSVSALRSTIQDGINGPSISIAGFDTPQAISASRYIVLQGGIDANLDHEDDFAFAAVADLDDAKAVGFQDSPNEDKQNVVRLLIGRVVIEGSPATIRAEQYVTTAQVLEHGMVNGKEARVFVAGSALA